MTGPDIRQQQTLDPVEIETAISRGSECLLDSLYSVL